MDVGDYYSKSINGFTKNLEIAIPALVGNVAIQFIGIIVGLLVFVLIGGLNYFDDYNYSNYSGYPDMTTILIIGAIFIIYIIIIALIYSFMYASTIGMAKKIIEWQRPKINVGLNKGKKYLLKIFLVGIIQAIIFMIASIPLGLGIYLGSVYSAYIILSIIVGGLVSLILYILIFLFFVFTYQSVVVSGKSVIGSFKDSFKLFKKNVGMVLIVLIINALILGVIFIGLFFINLFLGIIPIIGALIGIIISIVVNSITFPAFNLVLTYLYMDLKGEIPPETDYLDIG